MTVRELIKRLKKMPQHLKVGLAAHDNNAHEIAGWAESVHLFDKNDPEYAFPEHGNHCDRHWYDDNPTRVVVIR